MAEHQMLGPVEPRTWLMGSEAFERVMPHHAGIRALWETKWKFPVRLSLLWPRGGCWVLTGAVLQGGVSLPRRAVRGF